MNIELRPIHNQNWLKCVSLRVGTDQEKYVASNAFSLAQAAYESSYKPMGVYFQDVMVGFIMYGKDPDDDRYWISRLMIAQEHQGKGFGKAALVSAIEELAALPDCTEEIVLSYVPGNEHPEHMYEQVGFRKTGRIIEDEIEMVWKVGNKETIS